MSKPTALIDVENYDEYLDELSHQLNIDLKPVTEPLFREPYDLEDTIEKWAQKDFATLIPPHTVVLPPSTNTNNTNANRRPGSAPARKVASVPRPIITGASTPSKQKLDKQQIASIHALIDGLYLVPKMMGKRVTHKSPPDSSRTNATHTESEKASQTSKTSSTATPVSRASTGSAKSTRSRGGSLKKAQTPVIVIRLTAWERLKQGSIKRSQYLSDLQKNGEPIPPQYLDPTDMANVFHEFIQRDIINNKNRKHNPFLNIHTLVKLYVKKREKDDEAKKMNTAEKLHGLIRNKIYLTPEQIDAVQRNVQPGSFDPNTHNGPISKQTRAKQQQEEQERLEKRRKKAQVYEKKLNKVLQELQASKIYDMQLQQIERDMENNTSAENIEKRRVSFNRKSFTSARSLFSDTDAPGRASPIQDLGLDNKVSQHGFSFEGESSSPQKSHSPAKLRETPPNRDFRANKSLRRPSYIEPPNHNVDKGNPNSFVLSRTLTEAKLKLFVPYTPNKVRTTAENIVRKHTASWTKELFTNMENPQDASDYKPQTMVMNYYRRKIEQNLKKKQDSVTSPVADIDANEPNPNRGNNLVLEFQKMVLNDQMRNSYTQEESEKEKVEEKPVKSPVKRGNTGSNPLLTPRPKQTRKAKLDTNMSKKKRKGLPD